jgi:hypothetical protein
MERQPDDVLMDPLVETEELLPLPSIEEVRDWFDSEYWHQKHRDVSEVRAITVLLKRVDELETERSVLEVDVVNLKRAVLETIKDLQDGNTRVRTHLVGLLEDADDV